MNDAGDPARERAEVLARVTADAERECAAFAPRLETLRAVPFGVITNAVDPLAATRWVEPTVQPVPVTRLDARREVGSGALHELTVTEALAGLDAGTFTAVDLLEACLARIEAVDGHIGAVMTLDATGARAAAEAAHIRRQVGEDGALEGIPFGVKDIIATAGVRTSLGSERFRDWVPERSAASVARLQAAGAVMIAKLTTPEWSYGDTRPEHRSHNPWSARHWTGGSSSGVAAALASRQLPLALGTDTTGSIRVPSSYCGVSGILATTGRIPRDGVPPVAWTLDHTGPMARSAKDLALALDVLSGPSPGDAASRGPWVPASAVAPGVAGLRIGVPRHWFYADVDADVLADTERALSWFADAGAELVDVVIPSAELGGVLAFVISFSEFAAVHHDAGDHAEQYTRSALERVLCGRAFSATDYLQALRVRTVLQAELAAVFTRVDLLITPATPTAAPELEPEPHPMFAMGHAMWLDRVARNLMIANVTGIPAAVVPAGLTADGHPTAIQVLGPPGSDAGILAAAIAFQAGTDHHLAAPPEHQA